MIPILVILLSLVGLVISVYFTGVIYRWFSPDVAWIPHVCRMDEKTCVNVLETPRAKLLGLPNSVFGLGLYSYLILDQFFFPPYPGLFLLTAALIRSLYLAYSLLFITRLPCPLCFTTHGVNLALFGLYALICLAG